jgi:hypothetical protein
MEMETKLKTAACALAIAIAGASGAHAQTDTALLGTWVAKPVNPDAPAKLVLTNLVSTGGLQVTVFTACPPPSTAYCELGSAPGTVYSTSPSNGAGTTFLATISTQFRTIIITGGVNNVSSILKETDYNQASDIVPPPDNYVESNTFHKAAAATD